MTWWFHLLARRVDSLRERCDTLERVVSAVGSFRYAERCSPLLFRWGYYYAGSVAERSAGPRTHFWADYHEMFSEVCKVRAVRGYGRYLIGVLSDGRMRHHVYTGDAHLPNRYYSDRTDFYLWNNPISHLR